MRTLGVGLTVATLLLVGCGGGDGGEGEPAKSSPSGSPTTVETTEVPARDVQYGSLEEFRDAVLDTGYECKRWRQNNVVTLAAASGGCSAADVFSIYQSEAQRDKQVNKTREFGESIGMDFAPILVGPNWILNAPVGRLSAVQEGIGGILVES